MLRWKPLYSVHRTPVKQAVPQDAKKRKVKNFSIKKTRATFATRGKRSVEADDGCCQKDS